jgi:lipopolysaccharide export system permease protein
MTSGFPAAKQPFSNPFGWLTFGIPIMDRYIISELLMPFLFGVGAFSSLGVAIGVLFDLSRKIAEAGLSPLSALEVLLLKLPYFISFAIPLSLLLSCLIVYDRLSSDSELIALRSCGVSVYRLVAPAVALGIALTGVTFLFNESIVPAANYQATVTLERALDRKIKEPVNFQERNILYQEFRGGNNKRLSRMFYAEEFDGRQMKDLTILDFSQRGLNQIVVSESAVWNAEQNTWDFYNGTTYIVDQDAAYRNIVRFDHQQIQLPRTPLYIAESTTDPIEMNIAQIQRYLSMAEKSGDRKEIRKLKLRIDQKISFPFTCVVFGLVGSSLGIRSQRSSRRWVGFAVSLLVIVFYFLFTQVCDTLYQLNIFSSFIAAWLPIWCVLGFGIFLAARINR